jgi:hypothetical protein
MRKISLFAVAAALVLAGVAARLDTPAEAGVDPSQIMMNTRDLPTAHYVDYSVVFN